jgi:hypothetical protein
VDALRDHLTATRDVAIGRASGDRLDGTRIAVVATGRTRGGRIAGLPGLDRLVTAGRCTVAINILITARGATTVFGLASRDQLIATGYVAVSRTARHRIYCARVAIPALSWT